MRGRVVVTTQLPALSRERILTAAVTVADDEGLDAVTMRRLATALGVHPTSLYNHLASKEAILDGVLERLFDEMDLGTGYASWTDWVTDLADSMRRVAQAHRGAFLVLTRRPAIVESAMRNAEAALDAFTRAGVPLRVAGDAVAAVSLAVLGLALNECPPVTPMPTMLSSPRIAAYPLLLAAQQVTPTSNDTAWDLAIAMLIRGLADLTTD